MFCGVFISGMARRHGPASYMLAGGSLFVMVIWVVTVADVNFTMNNCYDSLRRGSLILLFVNKCKQTSVCMLSHVGLSFSQVE